MTDLDVPSRSRIRRLQTQEVRTCEVLPRLLPLSSARALSPPTPRPSGGIATAGATDGSSSAASRSPSSARTATRSAWAASEGRFKAIRLMARGNDVEMLDLKVVYANGAPDDIPVRSMIRQGSHTRPLDLRGRERAIQPDRHGLPLASEFPRPGDRLCRGAGLTAISFAQPCTAHCREPPERRLSLHLWK